MSGSLFESLVRHSMSLITDIDQSESMVVHEGDMYARAESGEEPQFKLDLNDKDIILEELEELMRFPRLRMVKMLYLEGVQNEAALCASLNLMPSAASLSIWGVLIFDCGL